MKSAPPPPVDRIERTVNPLALAILIVCLAGALLALWLAPSAIGATLLTWMIVILAVCGAFGLLLFAFGLLQFPTRAARQACLWSRVLLSRRMRRGRRPKGEMECGLSHARRRKCWIGHAVVK